MMIIVIIILIIVMMMMMMMIDDYLVGQGYNVIYHLNNALHAPCGRPRAFGVVCSTPPSG